jgi:hypothetical protein
MASTPQTWIVVLNPDAESELKALESRDLKATLTAIHKLTVLGPRLPPPHVKSLKGEPDLFELRPRGGRSAVRPIYARLGDRFVVLAVAKNKDAFDRSVEDARERLAQLRA